MSHPTPYSRRIKRPVTLRIETEIVAYFQQLSQEVGISTFAIARTNGSAPGSPGSQRHERHRHPLVASLRYHSRSGREAEGQAMVGQARGDVQSVIHLKVRAGILPTDAPTKVWAGPGTGMICSACDLAIRAPDLEYELQMADQRTLFFHQPCLAAWHLERMKMELG